MSKNIEDSVCCPRCGSTQVSAVQRGADAGMGCLGYLLFGWIGALLGLFGDSGRIEVVCLKCGAKWEPGGKKGGCLTTIGQMFLLVLLAIVLLVLLGLAGNGD